MINKIEEVYKILTARKIRRAWPSHPEKVKENIKYFLDSGQPLILTTTWLGVKTTEKGIADKADKAVLLFLKRNIVNELEKIDVKCIIKLLYADSNASYLEGYSKERIELYWNTLKPLTDSFSCFRLVRLNTEFWPNIFKLDGEEDITVEEIAEKMKSLDILEETKRRAEEIFKNPLFETFKTWAGKHSLLVKKGIFTTEEIAKRYVYFRIFGLLLYSKKFPYEIYFSYTNPELNELIISQPTIYIFSIYKGFSDCPWFIDENHEGLIRLIKMGKVNA